MSIPLGDVGCLPDVHRPARVNERLHRVIVPGRQHELLVLLGRACLLTCDESCADPHASCAVSTLRSAQIPECDQYGGKNVRERSGKSAPIGDAAGSNDHNRLARERALRVLAHIDDSGDENGEGRRTGVAAALAALGTDNVDACNASEKEGMPC